MTKKNGKGVFFKILSEIINIRYTGDAVCYFIFCRKCNILYDTNIV